MPKQIATDRVPADYKWLKENQIHTVGELREALAQLPDDVPLSLCTPANDENECDIFYHCYLTMFEGHLVIEHNVQDIWAYYADDLLTRLQHSVLLGLDNVCPDCHRIKKFDFDKQIYLPCSYCAKEK